MLLFYLFIYFWWGETPSSSNVNARRRPCPHPNGVVEHSLGMSDIGAIPQVFP